jgi:hypothetical protein
LKRLAIYNFNNFRLPSADPANDGFHQRNDLNFAAAEASDGFIARSGYADEPGPESWGEQVYPRFYVENGDGGAPSTLSLWRDLPSLFAFVHAEVHLEAMRSARVWFDPHRWPPYVLWWVAPDHVPVWAEGVERLEHLHDNGISSHAFDFKHPFDQDGNATKLDRAAVKNKRGQNASPLHGI